MAAVFVYKQVECCFKQKPIEPSFLGMTASSIDHFTPLENKSSIYETHSFIKKQKPLKAASVNHLSGRN